MAFDFLVLQQRIVFFNGRLSVFYIFRIKPAPKWRQRTESDYKTMGTVGVTKPILTVRQN